MAKSLLVVLVVLCISWMVASDSIGAGTAADPAWYFGKPQFMGNGAFHTYVVIDHENEKAVAIGCEFSRNFLVDPPIEQMTNAVGTKMAMSAVYLEFPDIAYAYTPFQSYSSNWMPFGHEGTPFFLPHIDFHFYLISNEARDIWAEGVCGLEGVSVETFCRGAQPIPADCCPPMYLSLGLTSPFMGSHLIYALDPILQGHKFDKTFIYGAMDGRIVFFEPMITLETFELMGNGTFPPTCWPIPLPARFPQGGNFPTQYCVDKTGDTYRIEMKDFQYIPGGCGKVEEIGAATCQYDAAADSAVKLNWVKNCNNCPWYKYTKDMAVDA